jgi:hypothetical protein
MAKQWKYGDKVRLIDVVDCPLMTVERVDGHFVVCFWVNQAYQQEIWTYPSWRLEEWEEE